MKEERRVGNYRGKERGARVTTTLLFLVGLPLQIGKRDGPDDYMDIDMGP